MVHIGSKSSTSRYTTLSSVNSVINSLVCENVVNWHQKAEAHGIDLSLELWFPGSEFLL